MKTITKITYRTAVAVVPAALALISFVPSNTRADTCISPPSGLVGWWPGDGNANDIIGGNNGTLTPHR